MIEENAGPETPDVRTPPESAAASAPALEAVRQLLPFHRQITDYLKTEEPEQWQWFSSTEYLDEHAKAARLELLKSCYRFSPEEHADLYARVERARSGLGLTVPVTVYQSQSAKAMNAFLSYVPGEVHVVLEGPIRSTLSDDELCATLAHELAHFYLWEAADRELLVAEQMLSAMASQPGSEPSHLESARLFNLYLEVHADRGALAVMQDPLVSISSLIKVQTGLVDAKAESYLRQSEEIFGQEDVKTEELTHPPSARSNARASPPPSAPARKQRS